MTLHGCPYAWASGWRVFFGGDCFCWLLEALPPRLLLVAVGADGI